MKIIHITINEHHILLRKFTTGLWDAIDYDTGVLIYEGDDATLEKVLDEAVKYTNGED